MAAKSLTKPVAIAPPQIADITIPCTRGIQCHREYYVAQLPFSEVKRILRISEAASSRDRPSATDFSAILQRLIEWSRVKKLVQYILHGYEVNNVRNGDFYILPGIVVAFNPGPGGVSEFVPLYDPDSMGESDFGVLRLPGDARFHVIDGQHRGASVEQAVALKAELADETLVVTFHIDLGAAFVQDAFVAINDNAKGVNTSTVLAMSQRDPRSQLARDVVTKLPWADRISVEATSISKSEKYLLFALNGFEKACRTLVGKSDLDAEATALFWQTVAQHMPVWQQAFELKDCRDLRQESYALLMIAMWAIAQAGAELREMYGANYLDALCGLENIEWKRSDPKWEGMGFTQNGILAINKYSQTILADHVREACVKFVGNVDGSAKN